MSLQELLREWYNDPDIRAKVLRWLWLVSLGMLVLGYAIMAYMLFFKP
ncbi:MAG TPA: hypothetical protein HA257_04795 [Candidatus Methanoperedenaceae archaeon]|nr:hypothetical protein [Candidatus Methanoperedenaceae archaeon]